VRPLASLPAVALTADGAARPELVEALEHVRVSQVLCAPAQCELTFAVRPGGPDVAAALGLGTWLAVGVQGQGERLFEGEVTAVERLFDPAAGREVRVRAYDALHRLRKRQGVRAHIQVSAEDLAQELAAGVGLEVSAAHPGPLWPRLIQHRQDDLELLVDVARRSGLYPVVRDGTLHLVTLEGTGETVPLRLGDSLLEARTEVNADGAFPEVQAAGWDPLRAEPHTGSAASPRLGRSVAASATTEDVGGGSLYGLVDEAAANDEQADALAQGELDWRTGRSVRLWGIAAGDTRLRPAATLEVRGLDPSVDGAHVLTSVLHVVDSKLGFRSEFSTTPPAPPARPRSAVLTPGTVTGIDDPEGLGRVKVSLPTYDDVETDWMEVLAAGAGRDKGLMATPDVGDLVLVGLAHDDPGQGLVLSSLYGTAGPPDAGIGDGRVERFTLLTPGGQRVVLDDGRRVVRLEDATGSVVEMGPDRVLVSAKVDLLMEAPGRSFVIRAQSVDFQTG
jgi:uncharacterized protein involved in type VI secretion and phage assembly